MQRQPDTIISCENAEDVEVDVAFDLVRRLLAVPVWRMRHGSGCAAGSAVGYAFTRSPDAADLSMAAMTSWRPTASAKSGTV